MPNDFIAIDVQGLEQLQAYFKDLPKELIDAGINNANPYIVNSMRAYAPYQYVSRARAYPGVVSRTPSGKPLVGWHSYKQFRYVMAKISEGTITPGQSNRTQELSHGWKIIGRGRNSMIANEVPYARYVQGSSQGEQAAHMQKIGWKGMDIEIRERMPKIIQKFEEGVKNVLKRRR